MMVHLVNFPITSFLVEKQIHICSFHRVKDYAVMQIVLCLPYPIFE